MTLGVGLGKHLVVQRLLGHRDVFSAAAQAQVPERPQQAACWQRYENVIDFEHEQSSAWETFDGAYGPFHDSDGERMEHCYPERRRALPRTGRSPTRSS